MKNSLYILILFTTMFAGELEVNGDLTVTGGINSPTIDALRDDGEYEYKIYIVSIGGASSNKISTNQSWWYALEDIVGGGDYSNSLGTFNTELTSLFNDGWQLSSINAGGGTINDLSWFIFKKPIDE